MAKNRKLTGEAWTDWVCMARRTLAGASQMVWQSPEERNANNILFAKVAGGVRVPDGDWQRSLTWSGAVLLALSVEQSLKAIAIRVTGECLKIHDLERLWNDVRAEDREGIVRVAQQLKAAVKDTRLAHGHHPTEVGGWTAIVQHHKETFENSRYHLEVGQRGWSLTRNVELWRLALAALRYAEALCAGPKPRPDPGVPVSSLENSGTR